MELTLMKCCREPFTGRLGHKIPLAMRVTLILLFAVFLNLKAENVFSQTLPNISLDMSQSSVEKVLNAIERQSGLYLVYNSKLIDVDRLVTVKFKDCPINVVLKELFKGTSVKYEVDGNHVILTPGADVLQQLERKVTGVVRDATGEPVIGANVVVKGNETQGTITDVDGKFALEVSEDVILYISFIGYIPKEVAVKGKNTVNVVLAEDLKTLDEVVVVGFGSQKKVNLTGAVTAVSMDKVLGERPVTNITTALQGAVPGLTFSTDGDNGGLQPGVGKKINVRGMASINGDGSPLILVDNVVTDNINLINPEDIESVSVLKDAASAAIYGARAAFGVILITTKQGKRNDRLSINYSANFAFSKVTNRPRAASPIQTVKGLKDMGYSAYWTGQNIDIWLGLLQEYSNNPSKYPDGWTDIDGTKYFLRETDVIGDMLETGFKQTHNVSATGGSEKINYRMALGYTNEDGILITDKDGYRRVNASSYISADITNWLTTSLDFKFANGTRSFPNAGWHQQFWHLNRPSYHPTGTLPYEGVEYLVQTPENAINQASEQTWNNRNTRLFSRTVLKPLKGLEAVLEYTYDYTVNRNRKYNNYFVLHQGLQDALNPSDPKNEFYMDRRFVSYNSLNLYATYKFDINQEHNFTLMGGFNQDSCNFERQWSKNFNMISNDLPSLAGGTGIVETSDSYDEYALRGAFYRINYNYKDRYLIETNGRYDGSSKFPKENRFGFFPSVSIGWNIAEEVFMAPLREVLSSLKLRGSWGQLGNQAIDNYGFYSVMNPEDAKWIYNGKVPTTLTTPGLVRANYTWEKVETINVGIDFSLLGNRLSGAFDWYRRDTKGMLAPGMDFPAVAGAAAPLQNAADLRTKGWELSISWRDQIRDWNYGIGFNLYDSRTKITRFNNDTYSLFTTKNGQEVNQYYKGYEIGTIWGYVTDGFYTDADFNADGTLKDGVVSINGVAIQHPGDIKYMNLRDGENSTNRIDRGDATLDNPGDLKIIGNNAARYNFGINGFVSWKGVDLSFLMQGVAKRDAWIGGEIMFPHAGTFSTFLSHQMDYWTPENPNAYYGRIYQNAQYAHSVNQWTQTKFLSNAAYLRMKNITLGYNLPKSLCQKMSLIGAKVFFSGENLFTISSLLPGIDPEALSWQYPMTATYSFGVSINL